MRSPYQQLAQPVVFELVEKRSRFICHLFPVTSRALAMAHLQELVQLFPDARHHCWAYLVGDPLQPVTQAYSDDGEPAGTAGKPILNVLAHRGAGDSVAIVVRYFGGVKLGAGGLVRAYSASVSQALDMATFVTQVPTSECQIDIAFADEATVRHVLAEIGAEVFGSDYSTGVILRVQVADDKKMACAKQLSDITRGRAAISWLED